MAIIPISVTKVSTNPSGDQGDKYSFGPVFSGDGTKVLFYSYATNLSVGDSNNKLDVFVKDLATGEVIRASSNLDGVLANNDSLLPSFSPDGTMVAFHSNASNLVGGDTNNFSDVFVKNLTTGVLTRVSTNAAGQQANGNSEEVSFSPDGSKVIFISKATNLVGGDVPNTYDVFVKTLASGAISRLTTGANDSSDSAHFSADGKQVVFHSTATNLVVGDTNDAGDIFIRNLLTNTTTRVSTNSAGVQADGESFDATFSADGTRLLFSSDATNLVAGDNNDATDVFVKDLTTGAVTRISSNANGEEGNGAAFEAVFSPDGTKVAFRSNASNLVENDTNGTDDLFIKDLVTGEVSRISTSVSGVESNDISGGISFSADGSKVVYWSWATTLTADGSNAAPQIYVATLGVGTPGSGGGANQAPVAENDAVTLAEGATSANLAPTLLSNDTDPNAGDSRTITSVNASGASGLVVFDQATQTLTYQAGAAFDSLAGGVSTTDSFSYNVTDAGGLSSTATVTVTVTGVNDAPTNTLPVAFSAQEDVAQVLSGLSVADVDAADVLTVTLQVSAGTLTVNDGVLGGVSASHITGNGSDTVVVSASAVAINMMLADTNGLRFSSPLNQSGVVTLTLNTTDGTASDSDTATITIAPVNDAPIAQADTYTLAEDNTLTVTTTNGVLLNDADSNDTPQNALSATLISGTNHGLLTFAADGSFVYVPTANYFGIDSFTYRVNDDQAVNNQGSEVTVTLNVTSANDAPVNTAPTAALVTPEDTAYAVAGVSVADVDGDILTVTLNATLGVLHVNTGVAGGLDAAAIAGNSSNTVTLTGTSAQINATLANVAGLVFAPEANLFGAAPITMTTSDGIESVVSTINLTVDSVNDAPVAVADIYAATEDTTLTIDAAAGVLANDRDLYDTPENQLHTTLISTTANGTLTLNPDGSFSYVPNANFNGVDSFSYRVDDNATADSEGNTVTVTLNVAPVNDATVLSDVNAAVSFNENAVNAAPDRIDTDVTLVDVDSADFETGNVTVAITGGTISDQLGIANIGTGAGEIGLSGSNVTYGGVVIGTITADGSNGSNLVVTLNAASNAAAVEALIEHLTYANTSNTPAATRGIAITVSDGDGGISLAQNTVITVVPELDTLSLTAATDNLIGGMGDDNFSGSFANLSAADTLQGSGGNDTLTFTTGTVNLNIASFPNISGIETIVLGTNAAHNLSFSNSYFASNSLTGNTLNVVTTPVFTTGIRVSAASVSNAAYRLNVTGNAGADSLTGGAGNDTLVGGNGNDTLTAGLGDDSLSGDAGNDTLVVTGAGFNLSDTILGGAGSDTLSVTTGALLLNTGTFANVLGIETINLGSNAAHQVTLSNGYYASSGFTGNNVVVTGASTVGIKVDASAVNAASKAINVTSGSGNDTITGTANNDSITSGTGNDSLAGGAGNDYFYFAGTAFNAGDTINGGAGTTDLIYINSGTSAIIAADLVNLSSVERIYVNNNAAHSVQVGDSVFATGLNVSYFTVYANTALTSGLNFDGSTITLATGHLSLAGANGNDTLRGGAGNDSMTGYSGNDLMQGGAGDDRLQFAAASQFTNADTLSGGAGLDTVSLTGGTGNFVFDGAVASITGIETFSLNTNGAHVVNLTDAYFAAPGLQGTTITFTTNSTTGVNFSGITALAHSYNLVFTSGNGNDTLQGSIGNDTFTSGVGNDSLVGGAGNDRFQFAAATQFTNADTIAGGAGSDTVSLTGGSGNFVFNSTTGNISGIETFSLNRNGAHVVTLDDSYFVAGELTTPSVAITSNSTTGVNFSAAAATSAANSVNFTSNTANDTLMGAGGNDTLNSGTGNDLVDGGAGNDLIINGSITAADSFAGGIGTDILRTNGGTLTYNSTTFTGITGIERFELNNNAAHSLTFNDSYYNSTGFDGNVVTVTMTSTGNVVVNGAAITTSTSKLSVTGGSGSNTFTGGAGNDTLDGGSGNDTLAGGIGADRLTGGSGNDYFNFLSNSDSGIGAGNRDVITDFATSGDRINLSAFAGTFVFRAGGAGEANFTGVAPQVAFQHVGGNTLIFADSNGDRVTDFQIELTGTIALTSGMFVL